VIAGEASEALQSRKAEKRICGTATQSHEGPNGMRGSVGGPDRGPYTGALAWWPYPSGKANSHLRRSG